MKVRQVWSFGLSTLPRRNIAVTTRGLRDLCLACASLDFDILPCPKPQQLATCQVSNGVCSQVVVLLCGGSAIQPQMLFASDTLLDPSFWKSNKYKACFVLVGFGLANCCLQTSSPRPHRPGNFVCFIDGFRMLAMLCSRGGPTRIWRSSRLRCLLYGLTPTAINVEI